MAEGSLPSLSTKSQPGASTAPSGLSLTQSLSASTSQTIISSSTPTILPSAQSLNNTIVFPESTSYSFASSTESNDASAGSTSFSSQSGSSMSSWSSNSITSSIDLVSWSSSISTPLSPTSRGSAVATTSTPQADSVSRSIPDTTDKLSGSPDAPLQPLSSTLDDIVSSHSPFPSLRFPQHVRPTHIANDVVTSSRSLFAFSSAASTQSQKAVPVFSSASSSTTSRGTEPQETVTIPVIAVEPSVNTATFTNGMISSAITNALATTYSTNLASGSGTVIAGQIVDLTQTSVRTTPTFVTTTPISNSPGYTDAPAEALSKNGTNTLPIAVVVPVLVSFLVVLPCIILVVRWHRRRSVRFMPDYRFVPHPPGHPYTARRLSNESVTTTHASQYSSVPSASMAHTGLLPRTFVSQSRTPSIRRDFSLHGRDDNLRSPLFVDTDVLPILARERGAASPSPSSTRSQSGWRAFSPTSSITESIHRVRSRIGTISSTHSGSHSPSELRSSSSPLSPMLYKNKGGGSQSDDPFADADWNFMDDPFANLNARSVDLDGGSRGDDRKMSTSSARSGILQKIRPKF